MQRGVYGDPPFHGEGEERAETSYLLDLLVLLEVVLVEVLGCHHERHVLGLEILHSVSKRGVVQLFTMYDEVENRVLKVGERIHE